jgi:hypothetical protein
LQNNLLLIRLRSRIFLRITLWSTHFKSIDLNGVFLKINPPQSPVAL